MKCPVCKNEETKKGKCKTLSEDDFIGVYLNVHLDFCQNCETNLLIVQMHTHSLNCQPRLSRKVKLLISESI